MNIITIDKCEVCSEEYGVRIPKGDYVKLCEKCAGVAVELAIPINRTIDAYFVCEDGSLAREPVIALLKTRNDGLFPACLSVDGIDIDRDVSSDDCFVGFYSDGEKPTPQQIKEVLDRMRRKEKE